MKKVLIGIAVVVVHAREPAARRAQTKAPARDAVVKGGAVGRDRVPDVTARKDGRQARRLGAARRRKESRRASEG